MYGVLGWGVLEGREPKRTLGSPLLEPNDVSRWLQGGHGFISCRFISPAGLPAQTIKSPEGSLKKGEAFLLGSALARYKKVAGGTVFWRRSNESDTWGEQCDQWGL